MPATDPTIDVVHAAIGFASAAVHDDAQAGQALAHDALAQDPTGFLDALMTTIQAIADDAEETGANPARHLRELGLGIHLAALHERSGIDPTST